MKNNVTREEIHRATGSQRTPVHIVEDMYGSDENVAAWKINSMNRSPDTNIIWMSLKVNETPLRMELDTGSAVSVIKKQQQQFDEYFPGMKTRYTSVTIKTYSGEEISPHGTEWMSMLNITDNNKSCH